MDTIQEQQARAERNYLLDQVKFLNSILEEARDVIEQLANGPKPGQPTLIHPLDLMVLIEKTPASELNWIYPEPGTYKEFTTISGTKYRQSVLMPIKTKDIR